MFVEGEGYEGGLAETREGYVGGLKTTGVDEKLNVRQPEGVKMRVVNPFAILSWET